MNNSFKETFQIIFDGLCNQFMPDNPVFVEHLLFSYLNTCYDEDKITGYTIQWVEVFKYIKVTIKPLEGEDVIFSNQPETS